ncbi:hypothetical protein [Algoriphagus sediminis]|uniref:Uncharacterized protein n=1 Tax=Algoriphagus sediminis TaxID=3057113 RepID=A0ABT7YB96_9BACT|nr:hypothetical protein [Algoriphagus sediminis]MDN3203784.1 hypothetical protein [Algoriphagus sediminis]
MNAFNESDAEKLIKCVKENTKGILANLDREAIDVYRFLISEFRKGDVSKNYLFQFVFRSYYRLDNAGLTPEFKSRYFELMEEKRDNQSIGIKDLLLELEKYPRIKENKKNQKKGSFQFSFVSKLLNTVDPEFPIYDSKVSKAIVGSAYNPAGTFDHKFNVYQSRHKVIRKTYSYILDRKSFKSLLSDFDEFFPDNGLSDLKKLDFIFWSYGKTIE